MGWILVLIGGLFLLVVIARKVVDHETARNLKYLGKFFAAAVGVIVLLVFLSLLLN